MKAKITLVSAQKGGVGKTTSTINLAACLAMRATPILVLDADPQGSTTDWVEMMQANEKKLFNYINVSDPNEAQAVKNLTKAIKEKSSIYNHIIVDCPPRLEKLVSVGLIHADLVLTACGVGAVEAWAFDDFNQLVKARQDVSGGQPIQHVFMSCVPRTWKRLIAQTLDNIEEAGFNPLQTIHMREVVCHAAGLGSCTIHMNDEKATSEIETLTTQVLEILNDIQ